MAVTITIDGDGLSLKKETNLQKAGQIIAFLGMEDTPGTILSKPGAGSPITLPTTKATSPKELIEEAKANTNAEKITVIGKYLSDQDGSDGFLIKEIQLQLRKMGAVPGNFTRDLKTALSLQYIYVIDPKENKYGVSEKGITAIQNRFTGETQRISVKSSGGFKKAIPPRDEVMNLDIVSSMDDFPNFHDLPTKADSILWVLAYADSKKIQELTPKEVEILTDKLRKKVPQNSFSAHNKKNMKAAFVALTSGKFKIQQKGLDHLKELVNESLHGEKTS